MHKREITGTHHTSPHEIMSRRRPRRWTRQEPIALPEEESRALRALAWVLCAIVIALAVSLVGAWL